ncbi:MAG: hypothetical protein ACKO1O_10475 [Erythrobacter sp.]
MAIQKAAQNPNNAKTPNEFFGWVFSTLGAAALIVVAGVTFHDVSASRSLKCGAPAGFLATDERNGHLVLVSPSSAEIALNGKLCLGYAHDGILSEDLKQLAESRADVKRLKDEREAARELRDSARAAAREPGLAVDVSGQRKRAADEAETALKAVEERLAAATVTQAAMPKNREFRIAIDGIPVPGFDATIKVQVEPTGTSTDPNGWTWKTMILRATSDASGDDGGTWRRLLADADQTGSKSVTISLVEKVDTGYVPRATLEEPQQFRVYKPLLLWLGAAGMVALFGGLIARGWKTAFLRDGGQGTSFSLARVQLLWWMFFVIGGFIFIAMVTGQYANVLTEGALTLLGISGMTAISARSIDNLSGRVAPKTTENFLKDILSDGSPGAISLQRVQIDLEHHSGHHFWLDRVLGVQFSGVRSWPAYPRRYRELDLCWFQVSGNEG